MRMKTAALQLCVRKDERAEDRKRTVERMLLELEKQKEKTDLILLPELWGCGFYEFEKYRAHGETMEGETVSFLREWAKRLGCMIHTGSFLETEGEALFNTSLLLGKAGEVLAKYRKIHLFGYESREQQILTPGHSVTVSETEFGRIGLATCYDLRFPEQFRRMEERGAELFLVTSAWSMERLTHWRLFNQVRALENQSFLLSCNCGVAERSSGESFLAGNSCGKEFPREAGAHCENCWPFAGHSMCVSPSGEILAEAGEEECILYAELEMEQVSRYRVSFPALADRVDI